MMAIIGITIIPIHYGNRDVLKEGSVSYHLTFSAEEWSGKRLSILLPLSKLSSLSSVSSLIPFLHRMILLMGLYIRIGLTP